MKLSPQEFVDQWGKTALKASTGLPNNAAVQGDKP